MTQWQEGYGVRIADLDENNGFSRQGKPLDPSSMEIAFDRLREALANSSELALHELCQIAVTYGHSDSAGISLEEEGPEGKLQFRWVAVAGSFAQYLNGTTPRFYSPCGTCLDRGTPQRYEVTQPYYSYLGVTAEPIREGLLIPWHGAHRQGTLWLVSHTGEDNFTANDFMLMRKLAAFVSAGVDNLTKMNR